MMKNFLVVNKKGFGSVYAVSLLLIVVAFSLLLITQAISYHNIQKSDLSYHQAQLFAIYHVKEMLKNGCVDISSPEDDQEMSKRDSEIPQKKFSQDEETLSYANTSVYLRYNEQSVSVQIDSFAFTLECDLDKEEIIDMVYS